MIYRIFPTKDTFITDDFRFPPSYVQLTGSNLGASEELDVFKRAGLSGAAGLLASSTLGRILMQFDFTQFTQLTSSGELPTGPYTYYLRMNHKSHGGPNPASFNLTIMPVSTSWNEGGGLDVRWLQDSGTANWLQPTNLTYWTNPGGDFISSITASAYFDTGFEDLSVDVTAFVNAWLSGNISNNGLGLMMTASIESNLLYTDYRTKKFYSRQSDFRDRRPYLEARANDVSRDFRANMSFGRSGTLFLYNFVGGIAQNLPGNFVTVGVQDGTNVALFYVTASQGSYPGIYSATFSVPTGSTYSGSVFYDTWGSGSYSFGTGSFTLTSSLPVQTVQQVPLTVRVRNLEDEYHTEDAPVLEVFFRKKPQTNPVFQTGSVGPAPYIVENGYYAIENDATGERVVPFGTGSQQETRMSFGGSGNSFKFFMSNLHSGNAYRIVFLVYENGRQQVLDQGIRFRVV